MHFMNCAIFLIHHIFLIYHIFKNPFYSFASFLLQTLAITNSTSVHIALAVFCMNIHRHFSWVYIGVEMLGHGICVCYMLLRTVFDTYENLFPPILPHLAFSLCLF